MSKEWTEDIDNECPKKRPVEEEKFIPSQEMPGAQVAGFIVDAREISVSERIGICRRLLVRSVAC